MNSGFGRPPGPSRRVFLKTTAVATAGLSIGWAAAGAPTPARGADVIRVGLVGCGGRGTGAARDCVAAAEGIEIHAMADLFPDRLDAARAHLQQALGDAFRVPDERCFTGFDAYQRVLESGVDVVILATPPGFRPIHLEAAVAAGKHVFMEKPVAVDVAGYRSVLASGERAAEQGLSVVAGTQYRRQASFVEAIRRIHEGMIGEIVSAQAYYLTGPIWLRERRPGMSDMEWQCRNWYYFNWLSGDHIVEQFVHNIDTLNWVMQKPPERALGMGGRLVRVEPAYGHIYDHFSVEYEYAGGVRVEAKCRQMEGCTTRVTNRIVGTRGTADLHPDRSMIVSHDGEVLYRHSERGNNPYVQEHADLIASIRRGEPINEARQVAESTLAAILGRESAYTGQALTWDDLLHANLDFLPKQFAFGELPVPPVPVPGRTSLDRTVGASPVEG